MQAPSSERTALENRVVEEADRIYTLDRKERQRLVCRIEAYDEVELRHFSDNLNCFGVDAVLEVLYGLRIEPPARRRRQ